MLAVFKPVYELLVDNRASIAYYDDNGYPSELKAKFYPYKQLAPGQDYFMSGLQFIQFYQCLRQLLITLEVNATRTNNVLKVELYLT